jgi:DNA-binding MarR family transcriptional regulator
LTSKIVADKTVDMSTNIFGQLMVVNQMTSKEPLGPMLTRTSRAVGNMLQKMFFKAGYDMSADEWAILANLVMLCDGQFQQQLADRTFKDKADITRLIVGLEKKGLVKRVQDEKDRRQKKIFLTSKSSKLVKKLLPVAKRAQLKGQKDIEPAQLEIFKLVLRQIFKNASEPE